MGDAPGGFMLRPGLVLRDCRDADLRTGEARYVVLGPSIQNLWMVTYAKTGGLVSAVPAELLLEHFAEVADG